MFMSLSLICWVSHAVRITPCYPCPQTLQPPISTFSPLAAPPLLQFGHSVAVDVDTVAIGCPGQPDAAKSNAPTGAVFVYDRSSASNHYVYRQVRAGAVGSGGECAGCM